MDGNRFDALSRALGAGASRRGTLGVLAGLAALGLSETAAKRGQRSPRGRGTSKVAICHQDMTLSVAPVAAAAHLDRQGGDRPGGCGMLGGEQTCENPTLLCSTRATTCDQNGLCACLWTTTSGTLCAFLGGGKCLANNAGCVLDSDCAEFGSGWACVPTYACDPDQRCGGNGNVCVPPCSG